LNFITYLKKCVRHRVYMHVIGGFIVFGFICSLCCMHMHVFLKLSEAK
jgi:hypothetical protein